MNKKIKLGLFVFIIIGVVILNFTYKNKNEETKTKKRKQNNLAIMIKEDGATDYIKSNSKDIPKGDYVLNRDKSYCKNNGKIGNYDSSLGKVSFSFIGTDSCYLYFDYDSEPKGYEKILLDNGNGATTVDEAKAYIDGRTTSTTPDFSTVATTNEGMFAADDDYTTTTGMKSYYFRGAVDNNWVKFGKDSSGNPIYWRIIRINGDGSIRMIYSGTTAPTESTKVVMTGTGTQISESSFNSSYNNPSYVGYMFTESQQHGNGTPSTIKKAIDKWYAGTTLEKDATTKSLVADQIFCNDRSVTDGTWSSSTSTTTYYAAYTRLVTNKSPKLTCPTASDKFTVNTSNGNVALTYPVGLITADEVAMAGGVYDSSNGNSSYYLYTNNIYWSGSPLNFHSKFIVAEEFQVDSSGNLSYNCVEDTRGTRPVISLSSKAKLSGSGTYNDVYRVTTDDFTEDTPSDKSFDTIFAANNTDIFNENGLRYEGADPNNYICLDNKTSGACSSSSLLFRIIGLFDEEYSTDGTTSAGKKNLLKILDANYYGGTDGKYWSGSSSNQSNNWSKSTLNAELNDSYLRTLLDTSGVNSKLENSIVISKWHLGGANKSSGSNYYTQKITTENFYKAERSPYATSGTLQNLYRGNPEYVFAKVGLMYPSDYGYATVGGSKISKENCRTNELYSWDSSSYSDCPNNDWLFTSQVTSWEVNRNRTEWLLSPAASSSIYASYIYASGYVNSSHFVYDYEFAVRPTFYLDSSILKIVGGLGTKDNAYRIG